MKRIFLYSVMWVGMSAGAFAQKDFYPEFKKLLQVNDTAGQLQLLKTWEKQDTASAEFYVCYFNYYVQKSKREYISIEEKQGGENSLQLNDTGTGQPRGYMNSVTEYHEPEINKGFAYAERGIIRFPDRLDLRFGKVYMYGTIKKYDDFTAEVVRTINYSYVNKNKWLWSEDKPKADGKKFLLDNIQTYVRQLYGAGDEQADNIRKIAEAVLKHYPEHVPSLSNLAIAHIIKKEYKKALDPLLKAEKITPDDYIVLNNIAFCHEEMGDKKKAIQYYELVEKHGNEQAKKRAREKIELLKKK